MPNPPPPQQQLWHNVIHNAPILCGAPTYFGALIFFGHPIFWGTTIFCGAPFWRPTIVWHPKVLAKSWQPHARIYVGSLGSHLVWLGIGWWCGRCARFSCILVGQQHFSPNMCRGLLPCISHRSYRTHPRLQREGSRRKVSLIKSR